MRSCDCGAPSPKGCWTRRAVPDPQGKGPPLVYVERLEKARKPCTNPACDGTMVFNARAERRGPKTVAPGADGIHAWTCVTCGCQEEVDSP